MNRRDTTQLSDGSDRAISTVADVSLAIVLLVMAIGTVGYLAAKDEPEHEPIESDRAAEVIASSTIDTSYSIEPSLKRANDNQYNLLDVDIDEIGEHNTYRISHGTISAHLSQLAVANTEYDGQSLTDAPETYTAAVDEAVQGRLLEIESWANVSATWELFEPASNDSVDIRGTIAIGPSPPPDADIHATTMTAPSGLPDIQDSVDQAVTGDDDFEGVASAIADGFIEGQLPPLESQRAIEGSGPDRVLTVSRYLTMATALDEESDPLEILDESDLQQGTANAHAANEALVDAFSEILGAELAKTFATDEQAANALAIGRVTIHVRTWDQ